MKQTTLFLLLSIGFSPSAFCDVIIPGVASYEPPAFFAGFRPHHDPGDNPFSGVAQAIEYLGTDNGYTHFRHLNVGTRMVGFTIGEGKRVTYAKVTEGDLKKLMLDTLAKRATNSPKVEEIVFAGSKAFKIHCVVPMPQIHAGITFLFDYIWVPVKPNQVLELKLVGSDEQLLKTVGDSLSTFRLLPQQQLPQRQPTELPIAKDVARLGNVRAEVVKAAGPPITSDPSSDVFWTGKYFVMVSYRMPNVTHVMYLRASDPKQFAAACKDCKQEGMSLVVPLQKEEIQQLLSHHSIDSAGATLSWKFIANNRWQRSDGALAGYNAEKSYLTIATKEIWPNLMDFQK